VLRNTAAVATVTTPIIAYMAIFLFGADLLLANVLRTTSVVSVCNIKDSLLDYAFVKPYYRIGMYRQEGYIGA
jgi:hypothetical protein